MAKKNKEKSVKIISKTSDLVKADESPRQKEVLTLFLFLMPLLLMAYSSDMIIKIGLFIYEAILLRNYIMDQYKKKEA